MERFSSSQSYPALSCRVSNGESSCICTIYHNGRALVMVVDNVETREEFRGQGYAQRLLSLVMDLARAQGVDSVELVVNRNNVAARRLYEGAGFEETDKVHCRRILNRWKI